MAKLILHICAACPAEIPDGWQIVLVRFARVVIIIERDREECFQNLRERFQQRFLFRRRNTMDIVLDYLAWVLGGEQIVAPGYLLRCRNNLPSKVAEMAMGSPTNNAYECQLYAPEDV